MSEVAVAPPAARPEEPSPKASALRRAATFLAGASVVIIPAIIVAGLFLSLYISRHQVIPVGADTPQYLWRARLAEVGGLSALPLHLPNPLNPNADRPGYPILASLFHAGTGVTAFQMSYLVPAVLSVVIGLAGAAFARGGMREPSWSFAVYAVLIGASVNVAITAYGYIDNLTIDGVLIAAALMALLAADGRPAIGAGVFLMVGAVAIHWIFVVLVAALIMGTAVLLVPESIVARRGGTKLWKTPSGRMATMVAAAIPPSLAVLFLAPARHGPPHGLIHHGQVGKLDRQLPYYRIPWVWPFALGGAVATAIPPRPQRIRALLMLGIWALSPLPAVFLLHHGYNVPSQRILGFAYGIPLLATAALVGVGRLLSAKVRWVGKPLAAVVVLAGMAAGVFLAHQAWYSRSPFMPTTSVPDLLTAAKYMEHTEPGHPVVFVTNNPALPWRGFIPGFRRLRAFAPPDHIGDIYMYPGRLADALAGKPDEPPDDTKLAHLSANAWPQLKYVMAQNPTLVVMRLYYPNFDQVRQQHPDWAITSRFLVARGPRPPASELQPGTLTLPPSSSTLVWKTVGIVLLLFLVGFGWAVALVPAGWLEKAGTAPAFGIAALAVSGLIADRLGFRLVGGSGVAIVIIAALLGWGTYALQLIPRDRLPWRRRRAAPAPEAV